MKFTKIIKNKEVVQYLSVFIILFLGVMLQFFGGSAGRSQNLSNEELATSIVSKENTINNASKLFVTIKPALKIVENYNNINGIKNLGILFVESISAYFIVCLFIDCQEQEVIRGIKKLLLSVFQYTIITFEKTG